MKIDVRDYDSTLETAGGFFVGWPSPPDEGTWRRLMKASTISLVAIEENRIVGYVTILTDGVLFASVTSIEVLPTHRLKGIGQALMNSAKDRLRELYAIDLVCDEEVVPFYESLGMVRLAGMGWRNYGRQSGSQLP